MNLRKFSIDFKQVQELFNKLPKCYSDQNTYKKSVENLIELFSHEFNANGDGNPLAGLMVWRGMIILLQMESLQDWDWNQLLNDILKLMNSVNKELRSKGETKVLKEFIQYTVPKDEMISTIQKIQASITISIVSGLISGRSIELAARVLDVFNEANQAMPIKERIDYKEFYNDAINREINLKEHFEQWIMDREKARALKQQFDRLKNFTLCSFPWLLDAANKADLLKISNKVQQ